MPCVNTEEDWIKYGWTTCLWVKACSHGGITICKVVKVRLHIQDPVVSVRVLRLFHNNSVDCDWYIYYCGYCTICHYQTTTTWLGAVLYQLDADADWLTDWLTHCTVMCSSLMQVWKVSLVIFKRECIPVGCTPSAAVVICRRGRVCLPRGVSA